MAFQSQAAGLQSMIMDMSLADDVAPVKKPDWNFSKLDNRLKKGVFHFTALPGELRHKVYEAALSCDHYIGHRYKGRKRGHYRQRLGDIGSKKGKVKFRKPIINLVRANRMIAMEAPPSLFDCTLLFTYVTDFVGFAAQLGAYRKYLSRSTIFVTYFDVRSTLVNKYHWVALHRLVKYLMDEHGRSRVGKFECASFADTTNPNFNDMQLQRMGKSRQTLHDDAHLDAFRLMYDAAKIAQNADLEEFWSEARDAATFFIG